MSERTLIITGGTGGLGTEVVRRLLRNYRCIVLFHSQHGFESLQNEIGERDRLEGLQAELANETSIRTAVAHAADRWGPFYGLVHLAGGFAAGSVEETSLETWSRMITLNTTSAFLAIRETLPRMSRPGRIVAVSSETTTSRSAGVTAYIVSKTALNSLIQLLALELKGTGITANALLPGSLATPAMKKQMDESKLVPLERVVDAIVFLLSDAAAGISGALIPVGIRP